MQLSHLTGWLQFSFGYGNRHKHNFYDSKTSTLISFSCRLSEITINTFPRPLNSTGVSLFAHRSALLCVAFLSPDSESPSHHTTAVLWLTSLWFSGHTFASGYLFLSLSIPLPPSLSLSLSLPLSLSPLSLAVGLVTTGGDGENSGP